MSKAPAFQFYANDFMDATRFWDANAVGLYVRCMCVQWTQGSIPSDMEALAMGLGMPLSDVMRGWEKVSSKFEADGQGGMINPRLEQARTKRDHVSEVRSEAAHSRWNANAPAKKVQRKMKKKIEEEVEILFSDSVYNDFEKVKAALPGLVTEGVDLEHYRQAILDWSDQKNEKRTDKGWLATFRQWTRGDRAKGELKMLVKKQAAWNPRA